MKILIVEDEKELSESIVSYLRSESFFCEVAHDYEKASEKVALYTYDCILLDITLPGGNGLTLLEEIKNKNRLDGVIIISAKNSLDDKIKGLGLGADDYLPKPFHLAELGARIKALIRRNKFEGSNLITIDSLVLDVSGKTVVIEGRKVDFTKSEFELLLFFLSNKNKVISKNAIGEHLSGDDSDRLDSYDFVYSHIKNVKRKIADAGGTDYIKTVYGLGYKFEHI